eukprot:gene18392-24093_t
MSSFSPTVYPTSFPTSFDDSSIQVERAVAAFVLLGVILGNLTGYVFENVSFPIPYHVVVFFEGVVISIALKYFVFIGSTFENVICTPNISNDLIIYVFLPALLFGETMNLNWHLVTSGFNQYMLLAGPGALMGGLITAVVAYYILPYGWSWQVCFLFGAVLSATDPVSVIAILKATGASNKLTTVIVGESLFNDGSPAIGIALGLIAHKLMRFFDSPTHPHIDIQIGITLACAYISFYVAEGPCNMSGVLSCCGAGLVISWLGSPKILDDEKMHLIWGNLEWFCNTLIFFLAGLIAGSNALDQSSLEFASLSLLINGSLAKVVIKWLKLIEDSNAPKSVEMIALLKQIKRSIRLKVQKELYLIENELGNYNLNEVNRLCRLMRGSQDIGDILNPNDVNTQRNFLLNINRISIDKSTKISNDILAYVRMTFLDTLRCRYWDSIRTGKLGTHAYSAKLLLYSIDVAYDYINSDPKVGLMDWDVVENGLMVDKYTFFIANVVDNICHFVNLYPGFVPYYEAKRERMAIYTLTNYIDAHLFAQSKIHEYLGGAYDENESTRESIGLSAAGPEEELVRKFSMELVEKARHLLSIIPPDDLIKFNSTRAARVILLKQLEVVQHMVHTGALSDKSASLIYQSIEDDSFQVEKERDSIHRAFLHDTSQRKKEEDKELRQSLRLTSAFDIVSETGIDPSSSKTPNLRPSFTNQTTRLSFRNSVRSEFGLSSSNMLNPSMSATTNPMIMETKSQEDSNI